MTDRDAILETLGRVRRRWRLRRLLEGLVVFAVLAVALVLVWTAVAARVDESATSGLRFAIWAGFGAGIVAVLWRAFRIRIDERDVALYVEEHEPSLRQSVLSAVETMQPVESHAGRSAPLIERLLGIARQRLGDVEDGRRVEAARLRRVSGALSVTAVGALLLFGLGPAGLRTSARALFDPGQPIDRPEPFTVQVKPGNATIPRGGAQVIEATLGGFTSDQAELVFRSDSTAEWERIPMERDSLAGRFLTRLFDVIRPTHYFIEAQGVQSRVFRLDVADLPTVQQLSASIQYPRYTGLPLESIEQAGDLAVLEGSTVTLRASVTRPVGAAYLVIDGSDPIPMEQGSDGRYAASFRVRTDGFYRVELETRDGRRFAGSLDFAIDALEDGEPTVRFAAPGRDTKVTSIEEVTAEVEAADDFGIRTVSLHVSVNGGPERVVVVMDSTVAPRKEVGAAHTFFLEEWNLEPGDLVSYFARATDGAGHQASSDMYFLEVRPFDRAYREAEQQGGGGGGGGESPQGLSERQRQIVVGTFNVVRDSASQGDREWRENVTTLAIGQGRLKADVASLVERMRQRGVANDSVFAVVADELDSALVNMGRAETSLGTRRPRVAMPDEQQALQHLQRAEAAFRETQVARGNQSGGGGGQGASAEELADLFELENDRLRNQYESVQQESAAQAEREVDETLEKLRRLASRQQQENERMQRQADALRNQGGRAGGGGGASQRDLAREAEEAARQLERLARERNDPSLGESARRLREAAEAMRRAASAGAEQGSAQGSEALERLRSAQRELERSRSDGRREEMRRLQARAEELQRKQAEIADQATSLPQDPQTRGQRAASLAERKDALARDVEQLEAATDRLSRDAARDQPGAARKLGEAVQGLRENRVRDKIVFSKSLLRGGSPDYVRAFEEQIGENLAEAAEQLRSAVGALEQSGGNREERALERARDLVRGLESLRDRARAAQERQRNAAAGREGQQGQEGEPGQQGETGQGQRGQQGQAGQAGEGRQGQDGQQAQGGQAGRGGEDGRRQPGASGQQQAADGTVRGSMSPGDIRQFGREFRARRQAAESLRADLRGLGEDVSDLNRLLSRFESMDDPSTFGDVRGLQRLEEELIEGLKNLEFALWRKFGSDGTQRPALGASARVPPEYRELVEEYYRSLARRQGQRP